MRKLSLQKVITAAVFLTLVISLVILVVLIIQAPNQVDPNLPNVQAKSHYTLMIAQCILGIVAMLLPGWIKKSWYIEIPSKMLIFYAIFLYGAIFLGEVRSYYYTFEYWDAILHTLSGGMLGTMGFSIVTMLDRSERTPITLSPLFIAIFAFCFAVTLGVFWEVYEFTFDGILGMNMQKFGLEDGTPFMGRDALNDTMVDLIVDSIGAFITTTIGYISLKYNKGWIEQFYIKFKK